MRDGWIETTLGDVCIKFGAGPFGSNMKVSTFVEQGIPVISGNHMTEIELVESSFNFITEKHAESMKSSLVQRNDVIITKAGTIGQVSLIPSNSKYLKYVLSSRQLFVRPDTKIIDPKFLTLFLKYGEGQIQILSNVNRTGVPSLSQAVSFVKRVKISLPPIAEQKRIVDLISSVDSYIEALQQQVDKARKSRNAVINETFNKYSEDWTSCNLGQVLDIYRGGSPRPIQSYLTHDEKAINWLKISDASLSDKYIYKTVQKIKPEGASRSRQVFSGDFVLSNSMSFGRPYIMKTDACIHDGWLLLANVEKHFDEDYLFNLLNSDVVQRQFESLAAGSGVRNLNIEVVKKVVVKIPPKDTQTKLCVPLNSLDLYINELNTLLRITKNLRSALLSDLLSGNHEIPTTYDKLIDAA